MDGRNSRFLTLCYIDTDWGSLAALVAFAMNEYSMYIH